MSSIYFLCVLPVIEYVMCLPNSRHSYLRGLDKKKVAKFNPLPTPPFLKKDFAELKEIFIFYDLYCFVQFKDFFMGWSPFEAIFGMTVGSHTSESYDRKSLSCWGNS